MDVILEGPASDHSDDEAYFVRRSSRSTRYSTQLPNRKPSGYWKKETNKRDAECHDTKRTVVQGVYCDRLKLIDVGEEGHVQGGGLSKKRDKEDEAFFFRRNEPATRKERRKAELQKSLRIWRTRGLMGVSLG
jgi:hypothetical protein